MSESQSRYSIVERLTTSKLEILSAKSALKNDVRKKQQYVEALKKDLADWTKNINKDIAQEKQQKQRQIEAAAIEAKNTADMVKDKEATYAEKIKQIDAALKSIENISKTTPTS